METQQQQSMKRGEFLRSLGLSSAALMAIYCMGACSKDGDSDNPTPTPSGNVDFTIDLSSSTYQSLQTIGNFTYKDNVLIARVKDGSYVALSKVCTHQGQTVQYRSSSNDVYCPAHGSVFDTTGKVTAPVQNGQGSLTAYKTTLTGNSLRVSQS